ncbi:MAG: aconitase X [Candidatus Thermoplasmatota archaeon]|nr:aconitase X [Candidatus Thermoplasmatota archaeon]
MGEGWGFGKVILFNEHFVKETYEKLNTGKDPNIVVLGCPHASLREISVLAEKLKGKKTEETIMDLHLKGYEGMR